MQRLQEARLCRWGLAALALAAVGCASTAPAPPPRGWARYVVQRGDTLGEIARCRAVSVAELVRVNGLSDPDRLDVGDALHVPGRDRCGERSAKAAVETPAPAVQEPPLPPVLARVSAAAPTVEEEACPPPEAALRRARRFLDAGRERFDAADFDAALLRADAAVEELEPWAGDQAHDALRADAHLLAAEAAAGLEQTERARDELRAARALDPGRRLDPATTSPRILQLMQE